MGEVLVCCSFSLSLVELCCLDWFVLSVKAGLGWLLAFTHYRVGCESASQQVSFSRAIVDDVNARSYELVQWKHF